MIEEFDPTTIKDEKDREEFILLLNLVEELKAENARLRSEHQRLLDEGNRLKAERRRRKSKTRKRKKKPTQKR